MNKKITLLFIYIILLQPLSQIFAAEQKETVEFFATVTSSSDANIITMTTNLYYNQLQTMDNYIIVDKRSDKYSESSALPSTISFFAEIQEKDGLWTCTLNAIKAEKAQKVSTSKSYDSYYKILLDAKSSISTLFENLNSGKKDGDDLQNEKNTVQNAQKIGIDTLAGTWRGEEQVDKIVILRGGRGFVIYKNGASMNIQVTVSDSNVTVKQTGRSNASFFPELPRETALQNATEAAPIFWELKAVNNKKLTGSKTTLLTDENSETGTKTGSYSVEWNKQ